MRLRVYLFFVLTVFFFSHANAEQRTYGNGALLLSGSFQQGTLLQGIVHPNKLDSELSPSEKDIANIELFLNDKSVRVNNEGLFVIGFGRDAALTQSISLKKQGVILVSDTINLDARQYKTQRVDGVPQKTVTPSKDKLARIRAETSLVKSARNIDSNLEFFLDTFKPPMNSQITGVYGSQRIFNGVPKRPHFGVDYAGPVGAPVYAPASGVITLFHEDMFYSGGTLIVDHGYGVSSTFIHLSEIVVGEGESVKQGQIIAKVGSGGRSTGPHLDWRVNWYQERIDPLLVLVKDQ